MLQDGIRIYYVLHQHYKTLILQVAIMKILRFISALQTFILQVSIRKYYVSHWHYKRSYHRSPLWKYYVSHRHYKRSYCMSALGNIMFYIGITLGNIHVLFWHFGISAFRTFILPVGIRSVCGALCHWTQQCFSSDVSFIFDTHL